MDIVHYEVNMDRGSEVLNLHPWNGSSPGELDVTI